VALPEFVCVIYPCAPLITGDADLNRHDAAIRMANDLTDRLRSVRLYAVGQFYFGKAESFHARARQLRVGSKRIEDERFIDINTPEDFAKAEALYAKLNATA
jgi:CMP-N-acetylneuraminic acid synthetase